jgi:hypothetical protein
VASTPVQRTGEPSKADFSRRKALRMVKSVEKGRTAGAPALLPFMADSGQSASSHPARFLAIRD